MRVLEEIEVRCLRKGILLLFRSMFPFFPIFSNFHKLVLFSRILPFSLPFLPLLASSYNIKKMRSSQKMQNKELPVLFLILESPLILPVFLYSFLGFL